MKNNFRLSVPDTESGQRIDSYLAEQIPGLTRSTVQNLLAETDAGIYTFADCNAIFIWIVVWCIC